MNGSFSQTDRVGSLSTELGRDVLNLIRFSGNDFLNGLFDYDVEALSSNTSINFDQLLGTHATVTIQSEPGVRHFDGIVTEARWSGAVESGNRYLLKLKPWFWLASRRRNQRIFHEQTVVEIIERLLSPYAALGKPAFELKLTGDYPKLEYTVQYRESDMDFAKRLMERFGISYHFEHGANNHKMVLTDSIVSHKPISGASRLFKPHDGSESIYEEHIWSWNSDRRLTTGAMRLMDYNFKTPKAAMEVDRVGDAAYAEGQIESYDYPGEYIDQGGGKDTASIRMAQERGQDFRQSAVGNCASFGAGMLISLTGAEAPKGQYLCLSATHEFQTEHYATGNASARNGYSGAYVLMPDHASLAPPRVTRIPTVQGPQTAVVVGEGEIDCDEFGRILVHFHWDLEMAYSMRCRVSQNWAGKGWGGMIVPRIGMEVIVEFLEGNPDKPIVTGCVYNGKNNPPEALPANKSKSIFKTKSHQGEGFNELTFEDQSGEEFIYMHAQKNLDVHVKNSAKRRVEFDDNVSVGNASNLDVAANRTETIEGKLDVKVTGPISEQTDGDRGADVGGAFAVKTGGDMTVKASGEIVLDASKITLVSGGTALTVSGGAVNVTPVLNVGSASPGSAAIPSIPDVLKAAAGEGSPFVSHCPLKDS